MRQDELNVSTTLLDEYDLRLGQNASDKYVLKNADGTLVSRKTFSTPGAALAHVKHASDKAEERFWDLYGEYRDDMFNEILRE